jgi:predicted membrane protein
MNLNDRLAWLAAPWTRQPWQGLMLAAAAFLAVALLQAPHLIAANTSAHSVWLAPGLMWAVCGGIIHGLGWQPQHPMSRLLSWPWLVWPLLLYGLWTTHPYFLSLLT